MSCTYVQSIEEIKERINISKEALNFTISGTLICPSCENECCLQSDEVLTEFKEVEFGRSTRKEEVPFDLLKTFICCACDTSWTVSSIDKLLY